MAIPDVPKSVVLDLAKEKLFIDGTEFPWFITDDGVTIEHLGDSRAMPVLRLGIIVGQEALTVIPAASRVDLHKVN